MRSTYSARRIVTTSLSLALAFAVLLSVGCSGRGESPTNETEARQRVNQFAIVTPEKESDHGWNQQGIWAAHAAADELGITLNEHANIGYDNTETVLSQIAEGNNDLIIAHASGFNAAGARVGEQTGVPTLVVDFDKNVPGKVGTLITQGQEGGYLAGVAAAHKTRTRTVGIVASAETLNWFLMSGGFTQGVYSVDPTITVIIAYIGPDNYADSAGGVAVMNQMIATGADVIMGMGDGATIGYLQAIESAETSVSYIATIGDVSAITTRPDTVFTSVLWNFTHAYLQAIADIEAGTFGTTLYELTVANGGLSLQDTDALTPEIAAAVAAAQANIADGSVKVARATDRDAVQALIDANGR